MGLDRTVRFASAETPAWEAVRSQLLRVGEAGQLRMIDNLPAFPDEDPPADWKELRVGTTGGMVTIRRGSGSLTCVVWGNADAALSAAFAKAIWACAAAGAGVVDMPSRALTAAEFAASEGVLPE